jgi:hypothetical protein
MYDVNKSPVGWYVASYIIRFIELDEPGNDDPESRFDAWENTIILRAFNFDDAYSRVLELAALETNPYKGGPEGIDVKWEFVGVTELLPIHEELEDGAEIMYQEHDQKKLADLRAMVKEKDELCRKPKPEGE